MPFPADFDIESQFSPLPSAPSLPSAQSAASAPFFPFPEVEKLERGGDRTLALSVTSDIAQYKAVMQKGSHPRELRRFYEENGIILFKPLSADMDTPFHIAAIFGDTHLLQVLLHIATTTYSRQEFKDMSEMVCNVINYDGNNILHQVAAGGEVKVLELLTKRIDVQTRAFLEADQIKKLMEKKNYLGETPIFKASALADLKMLKCMMAKIDPYFGFLQLLDHHLKNKKNETILEIAILGQNFDSAIWLLGHARDIFVKYKDTDMECLKQLAKMQHAFKSGYPMGIWHSLIYKFLPVPVDTDQYYTYYGIVVWAYHVLWLFIAKVIWPVHKVWEEKKTHSSAVKLLGVILREGKSWRDILCSKEGGEHRENEEDRVISVLEKIEFDPLLVAASNGIVEMVSGILDCHPIAIFTSNSKGWNLLSVAVAFRRVGIFSLLTEHWELPARRLATRIMKGPKYTVLHHVSDSSFTPIPQQFGPALQLQDEMRWVEKVEDITPNTILFNQNSEDFTARELFDNKHKELHESAQSWLKSTSESCSTVAILIAGVAFAGACTVPGDYNDKGYPHFLSNGLYKIFTTSVVVALTSSLISVVVFLSILTSPLPMRSFRHSLPQKLMWGFVALFASVMATMLAFMAAVMLVIGLKRKAWTTSLAYTTVFLPVLIMGIVQFPLVYLLERLVKPAVSKAVKKTVHHVTSFLIHFYDFKDRLSFKKEKKIH